MIGEDDVNHLFLSIKNLDASLKKLQ